MIARLASQFLRSSTSQFISFISWVSIAGVALGVMALTVVSSVINGFEGELSSIITSMNGDIVFYSRSEAFEDSESLENSLKEILPEIQAISPSLVTELMVAGSAAVSGALLEGVDPERIGLVTALPQHVIQGRLPVIDQEVAIGIYLAQKLGVQLPLRSDRPQELKLIFPAASSQGQVQKIAPRFLKVQVVGVVQMGMYEYDSKFLYMTLLAVQEFLELPGKVSHLHFKLQKRGWVMDGANQRPVFNAVAGAKKLAQSFDYPFRAKDWSQLNYNLFYAIELEKIVISLILSTIILVSAFNVVSTLMMMMNDKAKDLAILKVMGLLPRQGFLLFLILGLGLCVIGVVLGLCGGLFTLFILQKTHWIRIPQDIYYIPFLPVSVKMSEIGAIAGFAFVVVVIATLYPSFKVAKASPLQGLHQD